MNCLFSALTAAMLQHNGRTAGQPQPFQTYFLMLFFSVNYKPGKQGPVEHDVTDTEALGVLYAAKLAVYRTHTALSTSDVMICLTICSTNIVWNFRTL